ncbi:MAG: hypothetical protein SNI45_01955 [Rikenellaceae bacterium]
MKKIVNLSLALVALFVMAACGGPKSFGKMDAGFNGNGASAVSYSCTPEILTLNNGVVAADITVNYPASFFNSMVIVKITPVIVYEGGEVAAAPFYFQGSDVEDNYTVVSEAGGSFTESVEFAYADDMQLSDLQLRIELRNAKKAENAFYTINANSGLMLSDDQDSLLGSDSAAATELRASCGVVVAKGINTLQRDFAFAALMDEMANDYKAVTYDVSKANVNYSISSSRVNKSSLTEAQMVAFKEVIEANKDNASVTQSISANGYASPDGPEKFNDKLSTARSASAKKAMDKFFAEMGLEADVAAYGEDWDGFKELVAASSIQDKNLILQVLSLYDSSVQREAEIKNLSSVYTELKSDILPELRRTQLVNNISIQGMSDEQMMELVAAKNYAELTLEEMLYLADSVIEANADKKDILEYAAKKYSDARAYNNMGIVLAKMGDAEASLEAFEMATRNGASDATINKNLLLSNLDNNNYAEAKKYTGDTESSYALVAVEGNYTPAAQNLKGYNAAIANIMSNNYAAAKAAIADCKCPRGTYLLGVIASAEGEVEAGIAYIKAAVAEAPELAAKAQKDVNLANLFEGGLEL